MTASGATTDRGTVILHREWSEHFELFGEAYGLGALEIDRARAEVYDVLGFGRWAGARVEELSGGTRAKLNLGLALLPDPQILLLDKPYAGFDCAAAPRPAAPDRGGAALRVP